MSSMTVTFEATEEFHWKGGEIRSWPVEMKKGDTATVTVEQEGIDVHIEVTGPSGQPSLRMDNPNGSWGTEDLAWTADEQGNYRVEVASVSPTDAPGRVTFHCTEPRPASTEDRQRSAAFFHWSEGDRLRRLGTYRAATSRLEEALAIWRSLDESGRAIQLLGRLGKVAELQEDAEGARHRYREAVEVARASGDPKQHALFENLLARVALETGELEVAKNHIDRATTLAQGLDDPIPLLYVRNNLANWHYQSSRVDEAVRIQVELSRFWEEANRPLENAEILHNLGSVLSRSGHVEQAVEILQRCVDLRNAGGDDAGLLLSKINLGDAYYQNRSFETALESLEEARDLLGTTPIAARHEARLYLYLALAQSRLKSTKRTSIEKERLVLGLLGQARDIAEGTNLKSGVVLIDFNTAVFHLRNGRADKAFELFEQVYQGLEDSQDRTRKSQVLLGMAMAERHQGRLLEALDYAWKALADVETLRTALSSHQLRLWFLASKDRYFEELIEILMALHLGGDTPRSGPGYLDQALAGAQARRARSFLDSLDESELRSQVKPALLEVERRLVENLREVDASLRNADAEGLAFYESERSRLLLELDGVRGRMRQDHPQFVATTRPQSLKVKDIQERLLDPGDRLLVFSLGEEKSYAWSLDRTGPLRAHVLASRQVLKDGVEDGLKALRTVAPERQSYRQRVLRDLGDLLLGAALLEGPRPNRLVVVTDSFLDLVPFGALRLSPNSMAERYVIEEFEVVSIPSIAALDALRQEAASRPRPHYGRLVVGDPVYSKDDARLEPSSSFYSRDTAAPGFGSDPMQDSLRVAARRAGLSGEWHRLEFSGRETTALKDPRHSRQNRVLTGFQARKGDALMERLQGSRLVHFATHGVADRQRPELSALVLSLFDENGNPINGYLYAYDIYGVRLAAELVVLSACETGIGPTVPGEGVQGLSRAFLYAGAPRLVTSLWNVDDESTAELMIELYRLMTEARRSPSAALREAQVAMLRGEIDPAWTEPFYWAPFTFWGDWRPDEQRPTMADPDSIEKAETGGAVIEGKGTDVDFPTGGGKNSEGNSTNLDSYINGIEIETGQVLGRPDEPADAEQALADLELHPRVALNLQWWAEHHSVDDPLRLPVFSVDPDRLDQAGWVALFGPDVTPDIEEALAPLLRLRSRQAGRRYMDPIRLKDDATSMTFRRDHEIGFGPADPNVLPYYLLLVGDPERVPFELQYSLDVQYAIGRLHFDTADEYRRYAELIEHLENEPPAPRDVAVFAVKGPQPEEILLNEALSHPLARNLRTLRDKDPSWPSLRAISSTLKRDFEALLTDPPAFLFAAGHGLLCRPGNPRLESHLGALVCSDHHLSGRLDTDSYVSGKDLDRLRPHLQGLIAFFFACYGAGAPKLDTFHENATGPISEVAPRAMVSHLAKRMLAHGAQAFVGHVDRAWSLSFDWSSGRGDQTKVFDSVCRQLLSGARVGHALEWINQRYAEGAAELTEFAERLTLEPGDGEQIRRIRKATLDARNYLVIGDPAVRMPGFSEMRKRDLRA